jgi:hypothetical protein
MYWADFLIKSEEPKKSPATIPSGGVGHKCWYYFVEELCNKGKQQIGGIKRREKVGVDSHSLPLAAKSWMRANVCTFFSGHFHILNLGERRRGWGRMEY